MYKNNQKLNKLFNNLCITPHTTTCSTEKRMASRKYIYFPESFTVEPKQYKNIYKIKCCVCIKNNQIFWFGKIKRYFYVINK